MKTFEQKRKRDVCYFVTQSEYERSIELPVL